MRRCSREVLSRRGDCIARTTAAAAVVVTICCRTQPCCKRCGRLAALAAFAIHGHGHYSQCVVREPKWLGCVVACSSLVTGEPKLLSDFVACRPRHWESTFWCSEVRFISSHMQLPARPHFIYIASMVMQRGVTELLNTLDY